MPMVDADWTIDRATGNIRYVGDDHGGASPSYATVIEFHRWLQDFADDETSGSSDDELDIVDATPSDRSTDNIITLLNGFNIDGTASEHLFDGSIIQNGGDDIYDGFVNFGNASVQIQIIQNGAVLADDWWNFGGGGLNANALAGISHRFMLPTRVAGSDVDGRRVLGITRTFGNTYGEFAVNGTSRGNNVLALSDATDLNNASLVGDVALWTSIVNSSEGYTLIDVNNDTVDEAYYSQWTEGAGGETGRNGTINDIYERLKWLTRDGSASTLYGLNGELFRGVTHQIDLNTAGANSGTFNAFEEVSWTGGTGQMLAIEDTTASGADTMWIQLLTGVVPGNGVLITGGTSGATATTAAASAVTARPISTPFAGQSTGSNLIGSYGLGIATADLEAADLLFDLTNTSRQPPNNVTFSVSGLDFTVSEEDRVLVTDESLGGINFTQLALSGTLNTGAVTSITTSTAIPSDTPASGTIRLLMDDGRYRRIPYTSFSGSTFTIPSTSFTGDVATTGNNIFISYIDKAAAAATESFTVVYNADRTLFIRVRNGGTNPIRTFETTGTLGAGGGSSTAIRTADV